MLGSILRRCSGRVKATATLVPSLRALGGVRQRSCGLVGMPNVGKSTLFNALSRKQLAEAANYPFCTIDPNKAKVDIPDTRLEKLAALCSSERLLPGQIEFTDIAGLIAGASTGAGLGSKFLSNIRDVDVILHIVRCFEDDDVIHVDETVDPMRDIATIENELVLADLASVEKRLAVKPKRGKDPDPRAEDVRAALEACLPVLEKGEPVRTLPDIVADKDLCKRLQLLTAKPMMFVANLSEDGVIDDTKAAAWLKEVESYASSVNAGIVKVSAKIEEELISMEDEEERLEFLKDLGLPEAGLPQIIRESYKLLGLHTFYTVGPKEARAWHIPVGATAVDAAGTIHTDFARGFIRAETVSYDDYIEFGSPEGAAAKGRMRLEGKEYIVNDGDIMVFRFNV